MRYNLLNIVDQAKRRLWVMDYKNIKLDINTMDPFIQNEIEFLKEQKILIEKHIADKENKLIFKYEQLINHEARSQDFTVTLLKQRLDEFEVRAIILNENYIWNYNESEEDFINADFSNYEGITDDKVRGSLTIHSSGIVFGRAIGCYDDIQTAQKIVKVVESNINNSFIFD